MPVLLEGTSVVVRVNAIAERYSGFWPRFVEEVPNRTLCSDGELARVGFMDTRDAAAFVKALVARGLIAESDGEAVDCAVVEYEFGPRLRCSWLACGDAEFEGDHVRVARLVAGQSTRIAVPERWSLQKSLVKTGGIVPTNELLDHFEFLRSEGTIDVYRRRSTGEVVYIGRTTKSGRSRIWRLWNGGLRALEKLAFAGRWHRRGAVAVAQANRPQALEQMAIACRLRAEQGHAEAQYELGTMYTAGRGVPRDHEEAAKWYRRAAEQGLAQAQFALGVMYSEGQGVPQDYAEAIAWFRSAADQDYDAAQSQLGIIFYWGRGVRQDFAAAATWFRRAAERGDSAAQQGLATLYRLGQGVTQDEAEAAIWFRRAAEQGNPNAQFDLAASHTEGLGVPRDSIQAYMWFDLAARHFPPGKDRDDAASARSALRRSLTRAELAEAKRLAREWRATAT